jgi:hypothetical protein
MFEHIKWRKSEKYMSSGVGFCSFCEFCNVHTECRSIIVVLWIESKSALIYCSSLCRRRWEESSNKEDRNRTCKCNTESPSRNRFFRGKTIGNLIVRVCSLIYPTCNAHAPYYIVIYGLSSSIIFPKIISQTAQFS